MTQYAVKDETELTFIDGDEELRRYLRESVEDYNENYIRGWVIYPLDDNQAMHPTVELNVGWSA